MTIFPFFTSIHFGDVLIQTTTSENIEYVDFYIDDILMNTDDVFPYEWNWYETDFFKHTIKVVGYDNLENRVEDKLIIWKFF